MVVLNYSPGQVATIVLQILNDTGTRIDGYTVPIIDNVIAPNLVAASNYPTPMTKISTGLYIYKFMIPSGSISVGSYLVSTSYMKDISTLIQDLYQILVNAPNGNYTVVPG